VVINRRASVLILVSILLFIPYIEIGSNYSIEIRGGYGDVVIKPGEIYFAHYISIDTDDVFILGYTDYVTVKLNWTYPPNIILSLVVILDGKVAWVGMITEKDPPLSFRTGNYTVIKIRNSNSIEVDVDGYILYNSTEA